MRAVIIISIFIVFVAALCTKIAEAQQVRVTKNLAVLFVLI